MFNRMSAYFLMLIGVCMFIGAFTAKKGIGYGLLCVLIGGAFCAAAYFILKWKLFSRGKRLLPESRKYIPGSSLPVTNSHNLILTPGEICHLSENIKVGRLKTVTTGRVTSHSGGSIHIAKGVSIRSGTSSSKPIRKNVLDAVYGNLYVTNKRIVVSSPKYNFDKPMSALTSYTPYSDGFALQFGKETYTILPKDPIYVFSVTITAALLRQ